MRNAAGRARLCFLLLVVFPNGGLACQAASGWAAQVDSEIQALQAAVQAEQSKFSGPERPDEKEWVKRKLQHMVAVDQTVREAFSNPRLADWPPEGRNAFLLKLIPIIEAIDRANTADLQNLLKRHPWFTISSFGKQADGDAWLLVQHADLDPPFQRAVLDRLTELYPKGETSRSNYAYLWDRVAGHEGRKQRYGTQGRCAGPGKWEPFDIEDPATLDARRTGFGLPSMEVYKQTFKDEHLCP